MSDTKRQAVLKGIVDAEIVELMTKTTGDQVYLDENNSVSSKIAEIVNVINTQNTVHICEGQPSEMKDGDLYFIITE